MRTSILFLLSLIVLSTTACNKDCEDPTNPECPNYDPCHGKTTLSADFDLFEIADNGSRQIFKYPSDTICYYGLYFGAYPKDTLSDIYSYEWRIGTDTRVWTSRDFSLRFSVSEADSILVNSRIPITLTVRKRPICTNDTDTVKTFTKDVQINSIHKSRYRGTYEFYDEAFPSEKWIGTISHIYDPTNSDYSYYYRIRLDNVLHPNCTFDAQAFKGYTAAMIFDDVYQGPVPSPRPDLYEFIYYFKILVYAPYRGKVVIDIPYERQYTGGFPSSLPYSEYQVINNRRIIGRLIQ